MDKLPNHKSLQDQFTLFARFGDYKSDGKAISLLQVDKWLKQANIIDGKRISTIDTGMSFNKHRLQKIDYSNFLKFIEDLSLNKRIDVEDIKQKLVECGHPR